MGYRSLRVMNEDRIAPGKGFGPHAHRNMEIVTYVLEGGLAHKDSMGQQHVIGPNTIQAMSAGTGIVHSEYNASADQPVHLLQVRRSTGDGGCRAFLSGIFLCALGEERQAQILAGPHRSR